MAPSALLQSRINTFESLGATSSSLRSPSPPRTTSKSPNILETPISPEASTLSLITPITPPKYISRSPSPAPSISSKTSLIDLKDWVVDVGPSQSPPRQNGYVYRINSASGRNTGDRETKDEIERNGHKSNSAPLINLESPPISVKAPPLPPRKPSYASLKSASSLSSTTNRSSDSNWSLHPPPSPNSLKVEHTYPPWSKPHLSDSSRRGHAPASSVSSFHSVSLSSDGGTPDPPTPGSGTNQPTSANQEGGGGDENDSIYLGESFENVSTTPFMSPTTARSIAKDWEKAMAKRKPPPRLPQRPSSAHPSPPASSQSVPTSPKIRPHPTSSSSSTTTNAHRAAPPPPLQRVPPPPHSSRVSLTSASASDRSSILSTASRASVSTRASTQVFNNHTTLSRPTPVPAIARKRYETLFVANVVQWRLAEKTKLKRLPHLEAKKSRHTAGWRGFSVDLITAAVDPPFSKTETEKAEESKVDEMVGPDDRLDGGVVRMVWSSCRLERGKLRDIWNECDTAGLGSLDRDAFVKGMWRIDEELRKAHGNITHQSSASSSASSVGSYRIRQPTKLTNPKIILR